jgi:hypothetical protein
MTSRDERDTCWRWPLMEMARLRISLGVWSRERSKTGFSGGDDFEMSCDIVLGIGEMGEMFCTCKQE